ncbi:MAG: hypothetical protein AAB586_00025 [Patescibacteria group bacterium]
MGNRKYLPHIFTLLFTFILVFAMSGLFFPQTARAEIPPGGCPPGQKPITNPVTGEQFCVTADPSSSGAIVDTIFKPAINFVTDALLAPLGWLAVLILQIASLITYLSGIILNFVVKLTVVDMATNIKNIEAINTAWKTIRDVANMGFIFILLYAAIKTILGMGDDIKKLIVNIIIVAILINFSLFFTKIVIDASNVLAITFYDTIAPGATASNLSLGLSSSLMEPLKITSLWKITSPTQLFEGKKLIIVGVMGTVVSLIAAFVFFAVAIMFVIRFVVLIFVMILSPLAFMGYILPQLKKHKDDWMQALIGQAFFAPIYFMLTWIVIIVSRGLFASAGFSGAASGDMAKNFTGIAVADGNFAPPDTSSLALLMNFIIMIVFLITSLVIAKQWANKAGHGVPGLTKWVTGFAGGATLGMAGRLGRGTIGRAGAAIGDSETLKERAAKGGVGGMAARLALATGRKTGSASFDVRGSKASGTLEAGQAQKGGFLELRKKQAEREAKFAASLAPSAKAIAKDKTLLGNKAEIDQGIENLEKAKKRSVNEIRNSEELKSAEIREKSAYDTVSKLEAEARAVGNNLEEDKIKALETAKIQLEEIKKEAGEARKRVQEQTESTTESYETQKKTLRATEIKPASEIRKGKFADVVEKSRWASFRGYNYDAAAQIRKGKSAKDKAADILKDLQTEGVITEAEKPEAPAEKPPETPPTENT